MIQLTASDEVIALRKQLEESFVSMALTAVAGGHQRPSDITAVCPVECLRNYVPATIYKAMADMESQGDKVDIPGLYQFLTAQQAAKKEAQPHNRNLVHEEITAQELAGYACSIYGEYPETVLSYAQMVANEFRKRDAETRLFGLIADCQKYGNDTSEIANACTVLAQELENVSQEMPQDLSELMARVVSNAENGEQSKPLPTPWPNLNRVLKGGLVPGELAILAARPGMGKTALAGCIAVEMARMGKPVLFVSREVKDITIGNRLLAREASIDQTVFRQYADRAPGVLDKIRDAAAALSPLPLRVIEKSIAPMSPREVRRLAKSIKGIGLVVVDYLQLLCPDTKSNSREREVAEMSRSMKQLALDCDCPVLLLSQLNRASEESGRVPQLSDLRESGAIEQDADIVMFLHARREHKALAHMPVEAIVAKGRSSGTGAAKLKFMKPYSDFVEDDGVLSNAAVYSEPNVSEFM